MKGDDGILLFHTLHQRLGQCADTREVIALIIHECLGASRQESKPYITSSHVEDLLTRHLLHVSSPSCGPLTDIDASRLHVINKSDLLAQHNALQSLQVLFS